MTQILVTLNDDATTLHVRKAIELLRGVVSTTVLKTKDDATGAVIVGLRHTNRRSIDHTIAYLHGHHAIIRTTVQNLDHHAFGILE